MIFKFSYTDKDIYYVTSNGAIWMWKCTIFTAVICCCTDVRRNLFEETASPPNNPVECWLLHIKYLQLFGPIRGVWVYTDSRTTDSSTPHFKHRHLRPALGSFWVLWPWTSAAWPPASSPVILSAVLICQHTHSGLQKSITKCQGEASPSGTITEVWLRWFRAFVCLFFIIPRITSTQGEMNEWLSRMP